MSKTNNIVEFPEARLDDLKKVAAEFARSRSTEAKPTLRIENMTASGFAQMDAGESMYVARQLEYIRAGTYEVQYTDLVYDRLLPINRSVPLGKTELTIRVMDKVGQAEVLSEDVDTAPDVETSVVEKSTSFFTIGLGYKFTLTEIQMAMANGVPLQATKAMICRQQVERKVNDVALIGDAKAPSKSGGQKGLLNSTDAGILTYTPSTGTGSGTTALGIGKSADEILADLHGMVSKPWTSSKGIFSVNTLLLPLTTRTELASRRVGDGTNGSILQYFLGSDQFINSDDQVVGLWQLEDATATGTAGSWTGKRALAYRRDPSALELPIVQDFEQLSPQAVNYMIKTLCRLRMGGLMIYQPLTMITMDQI